MAEISLCMIVKNEEAVLARCLESIKNAVDEIIIADTGSTDSTKEIALRYTDKVYDFKWQNDFSKARNFAFSKAEKDYIMWLDADDFVTEGNCKKLLELKKKLDGTDAVMMKYETAFDEMGNASFSYYRERLIKKSANPIWKGRVHETIDFEGNAFYSDIAIRHYSVKTHYSKRNLEIYEKQIKDGESLLPRDKFYYGRELFYHKKYKKAVEILNDFLSDENGWNENKIEACKILSLCHQNMDDIQTALEILFKSFAFDTPRAEICCAAGNLFMQIHEYDSAIYWYELALSIPTDEKSGGFTDTDCHGYIPCIQLCVCYDRQGNHKTAEEYNKKAGFYRPKSQAYLHNLNYFKDLHERNAL